MICLTEMVHGKKIVFDAVGAVKDLRAGKERAICNLSNTRDCLVIAHFQKL